MGIKYIVFTSSTINFDFKGNQIQFNFSKLFKTGKCIQVHFDCIDPQHIEIRETFEKVLKTIFNTIFILWITQNFWSVTNLPLNNTQWSEIIFEGALMYLGIIYSSTCVLPWFFLEPVPLTKSYEISMFKRKCLKSKNIPSKMISHHWILCLNIEPFFQLYQTWNPQMHLQICSIRRY